MFAKDHPFYVLENMPYRYSIESSGARGSVLPSLDISNVTPQDHEHNDALYLYLPIWVVELNGSSVPDSELCQSTSQFASAAAEA